MRTALRRLPCLSSALSTLPCHACTVCQSATGEQVRAGLFNGHFLHTLGVVIAPFPVFAVTLWMFAAKFPEIRIEAERSNKTAEPKRYSGPLEAVR